MPTMIPAALLRQTLEPVTHDLLPEDRRGIETTITEMALMPLALWSLAISMKRLADSADAFAAAARRERAQS